MFRNYFITALRNLVRNKLYTTINIIGLAVGFAAALLIALFVRDEFTYDRWIPGHERIYRVSSSGDQVGIKRPVAIAPLGAEEFLKHEFSETEALTHISPLDRVSLRKGDIESLEYINWADANLFDVLPLPVIAGNLRTALETPDAIILTRSLARKYFGTDMPVGETIEVDRKYVMRVTAVLEDLPSDTHLSLGLIAPMYATNSPMDRTNVREAMYTYVRLPSEAAAARLQQTFPAFNARHPEITVGGRRPYALDAVVPIADIHLLPSIDDEMTPAGSITTAYSAIAIAILIVMVASINFINLTTARAARRAIEVGVRKVSGAMRRQLMAQFIGESIFYAVIGVACAIVSAALVLPAFNGFMQRTIALDFGRDPILLVAIVTIVALVGSAAGAYPALVLSRFSPATVLKGGPRARRGGSKGRQMLVGAQLAVLIVLALLAAGITRQVNYTSRAALRLDTDQMLMLPAAQLTQTDGCMPALLAEMRQLPGVQGATCISGPLLGAPGLFMEVEGPDGTRAKAQYLVVDFGALELYGLKPVAGRFFTSGYGGDAPPLDGKIDLGATVVINESMARGLGFLNPQEAIGKTIRYTPTIARTGAESRPDAIQEVIGVVPDFGASRDLRYSAAPRVFFIEPDSLLWGSMHLKLKGSQIPETLAEIDAVWKKMGPPRPIQHTFLDQTIDDMYREFKRAGETVAVFAAVAVFISCLGLFGLAAFAAEQRTKEIGVRKAMGASRTEILRLILWDFSKPVLWGSVIAWRIGYFLMRHWLENFADRLDIGLWMFPLATGAALLVAMATVIGHALLVARAQPVTALRYE